MSVEIEKLHDVRGQAGRDRLALHLGRGERVRELDVRSPPASPSRRRSSFGRTAVGIEYAATASEVSFF